MEASESEGGSVARVRAALRAGGHDDAVRRFPEGTRTAAEAAAALGCAVAEIAKSVVFRLGDRAVVVVASGADRVDPARLSALLGGEVGRADAAFVRAATGFAIGGVAPVGHLAPPVVVVEEGLFRHARVWAAAGSPSHVFGTTPEAILRLSGGRRAAVAA